MPGAVLPAREMVAGLEHGNDNGYVGGTFSSDDGKTFEHFGNLVEDPEEHYGYQRVDFLGEDLVLIAFHTRDGMPRTRIGSDWFFEN